MKIVPLAAISTLRNREELFNVYDNVGQITRAERERRTFNRIERRPDGAVVMDTVEATRWEDNQLAWSFGRASRGPARDWNGFLKRKGEADKTLSLTWNAAGKLTDYSSSGHPSLVYAELRNAEEGYTLETPLPTAYPFYPDLEMPGP